jgi:hypothetical protein
VVMLAHKAVGSAEVDVTERRYPGGETRKVFQYVERRKADGSGNLWSGRPASIALSPDGGQLAYVDSEGLRVRTLANGTQRDIIHQVSPGLSEHEPALWSIKFPFSIYGFTDPVWSPDGGSISVAAIPMEGSWQAIVSLDGSLRAFFPNWGRISWATGVAFVTVNTPYGSGVQNLDLHGPPDWNVRVPLWDGDDNHNPTRIIGAAWSADAKTVLFLGARLHYYESGPLRLRMVDSDDPRTERSLAEVPNDDTWFRALQGWPFLSRDGATVYYAHGGPHPSIMALPLFSGEARAVAPFPGGFTTIRPLEWISESSLVLVGAFTYGWSQPEASPSQVLLIDITTGEVRPITGLLPPYTSVLSVERLP